MKKIICLTLALAMLALCAAGCVTKTPGSTVLPGKEAQDTKPTGSLISTTEPTTEPITEPTTQPTTEPSTEPATEPATEPDEEESNLSLGRMEGGTYVNEYMGIRCELDTNWQFYTAKELQEMPDQLNEATKGTELNEMMANIEVFTDMRAENLTDLTSINVVYQKLTFQQRLAYAVTTEEAVVDALLGEMQMMSDYYAAAGITLQSMEKVKVTFLGQERYAIYSVNDIQGIPYYTLQLFDGTLGEYSVTLTLASYVEDTTQSLLDLFTPIE